MRTAAVVTAAHRCLAAALRPGDLAVDATAGNGHDTAFLARAVGPAGRVLALDVQDRAVAAAGERLRAAGLDGRVDLRRGGHEELACLAPPAWAGRVRAVVFNLGYLPGAERGRITRPATTLAGLEAAAGLLAPGGRLAVVAYPGHGGGAEEAAAVAAWVRAATGFRRLADGRMRILRPRRAPRLVALERPLN